VVERISNCGCQVLCRGERLQIDKAGPICESLALAICGLKGKASFAGAAQPDNRQQPAGRISQELVKVGQFAGTTDEGGWLDGKMGFYSWLLRPR
jgi:hypothetical protein